MGRTYLIATETEIARAVTRLNHSGHPVTRHTLPGGRLAITVHGPASVDVEEALICEAPSARTLY